MFLPRLVVLLVGSLACALVQADSFGFSWDNDLFLGQDENYTNGGRFSWVGDQQSDCQTTGGFICGAARFLDPLPGMSVANERHAVTVSLEQIMITPSDISRTTTDYNDFPYVGYSNLEVSLFSWNDSTLSGYGVRAGIVGPDSGAEQTQRFIHKMVGANKPRGWDEQLGHDAIGGVYFLNAHRLFRITNDAGYQTELGVTWSVDVNNFDGHAQAGAFLRFGRNLPGNFIPDYAGIGTTGALVGLFDNPGFGWEVFFGLSGQYSGYSYVEEHTPEYHFDTRNGQGTVITGLGLHTGGGFNLTMTVQNSTSPIRDDNDLLSFGNLSFMWEI